MHRPKLFGSLLSLIGFAGTPIRRTAAQNGSPAAGAPSAMSAEQTRAVLS